MAYQVGPQRCVGLLWLMGILWGCAAPQQSSLDVIALGRVVGLRAPYTNRHVFQADSEQLFSRLLDSLEGRGAQILVADSRSGFVSWCDGGLTFVAMPTQLQQPSDTSTAGLMPSPARWNGIVHGAAKIRRTEEKSWLYLHTEGWELHSTKAVFSDGSYEKDIFRAVGAAGTRGTSDRLALGGEPDQNSPTVAGGSPPPVAQIRSCFPHFGNVSGVSGRVIREKGLSKVYPVPLDELWAACLNVISQYSATVSASRTERVILFVQRMALPNEASGKELQHVQALLALSAEPRGPDGSTLYGAVLSSHDLAVSSIRDLSQKSEKEVLEELKRAPTEFAAALIMDRLFEQLTAQLFYQDRWEGKFTRRYLSKEENK